MTITIPVNAEYSETLGNWVNTEIEHHNSQLVPNFYVSNDKLSNNSLPPGCNYTVPGNISGVLCVSNANSPVYNPVNLALAVSAIPTIQVLSFAVDVAPDGTPALDDLLLQQVGRNLNSSNVYSLHVFVGELTNVTSMGIVQFTSLSATAQSSLTDLGFSLEHNQLTDSDIEQMGNIVGRLYYQLMSLSLDFSDQYSKDLTGSGFVLLVDNLNMNRRIDTFSLDMSGNNIDDSLGSMGKILGVWPALNKLSLYNSNVPQPNQTSVTVGDNEAVAFFTGLTGLANLSRLSDLTVDLAFNNISDDGITSIAGIAGHNLSKLLTLETIFDYQSRPATATGIRRAIAAIGNLWQMIGTWSLSIERNIAPVGTSNQTETVDTIIEAGSDLANITDALTCTNNPAFFKGGVSLAPLVFPLNQSICASTITALPVLQNGSACKTTGLVLQIVGQFVQQCNLTQKYCGSC
jgi:hypothetical protein